MNPYAFDKQTYQRYGRQMLLPFLGRPGQQLLLESKVLVVGAGGIGSSLLMYLAASGVNLTIVDHDTVDVSNLHRQIIHDTASEGQNKAVSATQRLGSINPSGRYLAISEKFTCTNALDLVSDHSLVVDCTDNTDARYIINDACVLANKPWITASAIGLEAQVHVIIPRVTACYRCLHPEISVTESCRSCSNVGILGPVAGMIGCLQAIEVLKFISSHQPQPIASSSLKPTGLVDKQLYYDGYASEFISLGLPRRSTQCAVCGDSPSIFNLSDTHVFLDSTSKHVLQCVSEHIGTLEETYEVSPRAYKQYYEEDPKTHIILDVRPALQFDLLHLRLPGLVKVASLTSDNATSVASTRYILNIPFPQFQALRSLYTPDIETSPVVTSLRQFLANIQGTGKQPVIYALCRRGVDSKIVTRVLRNQVMLEFPVFNITGGYVAWSEQVDDSFPVY
eukprot:gene32120-38843_t